MMVKDTKIIGLLEVLKYVFCIMHVRFLWFSKESTNHSHGKWQVRLSIRQVIQFTYDSPIEGLVYLFHMHVKLHFQSLNHQCIHKIIILKTKLLQDSKSITPFVTKNHILQIFKFYPQVSFNMSKVGHLKSRVEFFF
jgi:hypothetical protein